SATLTVNRLTTASPLVNLTLCPGQDATFTTVASGTGPFSFVWSKDGQIIATETTDHITLNNITAANAGTYSVHVSGTCNSVDKSATLTVNEDTSATPLTSVVLCPGQPATFATVASGTGPLTYVWKKDGVAQSSTSNTLSIASVAATNAGTYSIEITGTCTSVTNTATLTVNENTAATALTDLVLCPGQSTTFTTVVSGTGPFGFVWKKDGVVLVGQTTNSFSIGPVTATDAGTYTVEVVGVCNSVTNNAVITINQNVSSSALTDLVVCQGAPAIFSTTPAGTGPYTYVWKKDGAVLSGETHNSLTIASADLGNAGTYSVEVAGVCTAVTNSATLIVNSTTTVSDLTGLTLCPGQNATFSAVPSGTGPFTYVWSKDGQIIASETTDHITLNNVTAANGGTYSVHVTGTCNSADKSATLTVNENTAATGLSDLVLCPGQTATFTTTVSGTGPFGFVWKKDGVVLVGETTNTISVASVTAANGGIYTVEVTGVCNSVTNNATLTVNENVSATALSDVVVCENQPASFSTTASGTGPLAYVWKKDGSVLSGQTDSSVSIASAQVSDAGIYTVEVTGLCTSVTNSAMLTVNRLTTTSDLTSLVVCPTQSATFTTVPSGTGPFTYVWSKDGQVIATETTDHITLNNVTAANAGTYSVHVTGTCNSVDKSATLTVNENTSATALTSLVLCPGQAATFSTIASGTGPLSYVWKKDGVVQSNATNALTIAAVRSTDAGTYTVEVTGTCTSVTNVATLTVNENTAATSLSDLVLCPGQTATFTTTVSGTGPFGFVWKKDGVVLVGETTNTISVASVTAANGGIYTVEVAGVCNSVTNNATLTVNQNVSATALSDVVVCENQLATFSTSASGTGPLAYVWKKDGTVLSGQTNSSISIASAQVANAGTYTVEVTGLCTSVTNSATLTVNRLTATSDLTSLVVCPSQSATFTTVPSGTGPFSFVWSKDGQIIASETTDHITLNNITAANGGTYSVHVTGTCNSADKSATLTVNENTVATSLSDLVLCATQTATFTTTVTGTGPFGFVWKKDGVVLVGETTNTISVASVTATNAGSYTVEVTGTCNSVTNNATLTVNQNVSATALSDVTVCENQPATFSTTASGTGPLAYVWKKDGTVLSGQTDSSISIGSAQVANAGTYTVEVTGLCTSVTNSATLTVNRLTTTSDLTSVVVCPSQSATFTTVPSGTGPFTYVWSKDGQTIVTETADHITLNNVTAANAGTYSVHVTGTCNSADKSATLTVNENTAATSLTDLVLCPTQTATFTTTVSGTGPFGFVWKKDGAVLTGETTNTISIASVTTANAGTYTVEVTGVCNSVTNTAILTVNQNVGATALTDVTVCENQPVAFSTTASGTGPLAYVWKKDGSVMLGQTNSSISIASAQVANAGVYTVEVTGLCTSVTNSATLTVNRLTTASPLVNLTLCPGQDATFTTVASGTGPFSFVWSKDG
ncbi:MAG: beta strand repeat-containing protein, partial [Limisphaerales bacterium]